MSLQWSNSLSTGLDWQDDQHKQLIKNINNLLEAMQHNSAREEIGNLLAFLEQYVIFHFNDEEEYMTVSRYPGEAAHLAEHRNFKDIVKDLKDHYEKQGASSYVIMKAHRSMQDWVVSHLSRTDKLLAAHLLANKTTIVKKKFLQWNKALSTGLIWQDEQHVELFGHISTLVEAIQTHRAKEEIGNLLTFLVKYINFHFTNEKDQMIATGYPDVVEHLALHEEFTNNVLEMKSMYEKQGPSPYIIMKAQSSVRDWFLKHIVQVDKPLAKYLLENPVKNVADSESAPEAKT